MNYDEFKLREKELEQELQDKKRILVKEFVNKNNPHKVGDKVTDHIGSILIDKIGYSWGFMSQPCATYTGLELKKDGKPTKKQYVRTVYQSNLINP